MLNNLVYNYVGLKYEIAIKFYVVMIDYVFSQFLRVDTPNGFPLSQRLYKELTDIQVSLLFFDSFLFFCKYPVRYQQFICCMIVIFKIQNEFILNKHGLL